MSAMDKWEHARWHGTPDNALTLSDKAEHISRIIKDSDHLVLLAAFDSLMEDIWRELALADTKIKSITREITGAFDGR